MKKKIPLEYKFSLDRPISIVNFNEKILVISPLTANWIVLNNLSQLKFFNLLREYSIGDSLSLYSGNEIDAKFVVKQIVARNFENIEVRSCISNQTKQLHLYLTNGCNLHCPHCYMFSGVKRDNELTLTEIKYIIHNFSKMGGNSITLSGGEVTTRKDFKDIIECAYDHKLRIRVLTNGVLWNEELISSIATKIEAVQVSIDGYSEESNSIIRGHGNFIKSLKTVESLINYGISTEIAITAPFSIIANDEADKYTAFCKDLLNRYNGKNFKMKIAEQLIEGRKIHLTDNESYQYTQYINKIKSSINGWKSELESFIRTFGKKEIMDNCMYGVFAIDAVGDVFLCSRVSSLKPIGNIRAMSFKEIFSYSKKAQELSKIDNFRPCNNCELRYICGGGCRIDYFPEFALITDVDNVDFSKISERKCTNKVKERFYQLMIDSNEHLFS